MKKANTGISKLWFWLGLGLFMVMFLLLMVQIDRQWTKMDEMTRIMEEQAKDIRSTRGLLRNLEHSFLPNVRLHQHHYKFLQVHKNHSTVF